MLHRYVLATGRADADYAAFADNVGRTVGIVGGTIYTANPTQPKAEALAIAGERILRVGTRQDIGESAADVLEEPILVAKATGTTVVTADLQRLQRG